MEISFYFNKSEKTKINKDITQVKINGRDSITCHLKVDTPVEEPVIYVDSADVLKANYAKIPEWGGRYYFIKSVDYCIGKRYRVYLSEDVLMSYANEIKSSTAYIERSETLGDVYMQDPNLPLLTKRDVFCIPLIEQAFDTVLRNYLVVTGGDPQ